MEGLKLYLEKFKNLVPADTALKTSLRQAIKEVVGVDISDQALIIQHWTVYIKATPALRSEIYLHREQITTRLGELLGRQDRHQLL